MAAGSMAAPRGRAVSLLVPMQHTLGLSTLVVGSVDHTTDPRPTTGRTRASSTVARPGDLGQLVRSAVAPESRKHADPSKKKEMKQANPLRSLMVKKKMEEIPFNEGTKVFNEGTKVEDLDSEEKKMNEMETVEDMKAGRPVSYTPTFKETFKTEKEFANPLSPVKVKKDEQDEMGEEYGVTACDIPPWDFEDLTLEDQEETELKEPIFELEKKEPPASPLKALVCRKWNEFSSNIPPLPGLAAIPPLAKLLRTGRDKIGEGQVSRGHKLPKAPTRGRRGRLRSALRWNKKRTLLGIEKDFYSDTSRAPKDSRRHTVQKLMACKEVKLNVEKIKWIASAFKEAGYKSGSSYLAEAKLMHVEGGGDWTPQLDRIFKMSKRALDRGRGPKKKAPEVPMERRKEANYQNKVINTKVLFPRELFQFGMAWMLREVEIAAFLASDVEVDLVRRRLTLCWRSSKCDQEGGEVRRTLQCLCSDTSCAWECPFFSTMDLLDKVVKANGVDTKLALTPNFKTPKKSQIVDAWCNVFKMKVTGHSARRTGALHYIREGWDIPQVGYLGRWKSAMILEYAKEALETMPANRHLVPSSWSPSTDSTDVSKLLAENEKAVKKQVEDFKKDVATVKAELMVKMKELENDCSDGGGNLPRLVQSLAGKVIHDNVALVASSPPITWRTKCGWFFGKSNFCFVQGMGTVNCLKCKAAQSIEVGDKQL